MLCILGSASVSVALCGCAMTHQSVRGPSGETSGSWVVAVWPGTSAIEKASVRQTKTGQSIGLTGATLEGGGTNLVEALKEARQIIQTVAGAAK